MKCPRCGSEMEIDSHRKIPLNMCYTCGYIEGRATEGGVLQRTNFEHLNGLNVTEAAAFLSAGLQSKGIDISEELIVGWMVEPME